jgi:hypothetical protein
MESTKNSFFLILGMHRSGTSCLTGSLERSGVYLGEVKRKGKHNKKGYFEKEEVYKIHDQILGLNKSSWYKLPLNKTIIIHPNHAQKLEEIANELKTQMPCGLKDPRTIPLLDFWKKIIGEKLQMVGTFRHPMAVAQSLHTRNQFPIEKGLQLWYEYNKILVEEHKIKPFPIIHFDLSNSKKYRQKIIKMAKSFGLKPKPFKLWFFISKKLEHHQNNKIEVPLNCKELYEYLLKNQV